MRCRVRDAWPSSAPPRAKHGGKSDRTVRGGLRRRRRRVRRLGRGGGLRRAVIGRTLLCDWARRRERVCRGHGTRSASATAVLARGHPLELLTQRPFGFFGGDLYAFDQRGVLRLAPMRLHVAVPIGVENAELPRSH